MKKNVLLIGGRSKAKALSLSLVSKGCRVTVINNSREDCQMLADSGKCTVICGDGTKQYVLEDADASSMDIAIALTNADEDNLVACQLCRKRFGVKRTISLLNDPKKTDFFYAMGVDRVICTISAVTDIIEQQAFMEEMTNVIPISEGKIHIVEVEISQKDPSVSRQIWEIDLPKEVIIGCILRQNQTLIPRGDTRIRAGDILVLICGEGQEKYALLELKGGA